MFQSSFPNLVVTLLLPFITVWVHAQRSSLNIQFQLTEECPEGTIVGCLNDDFNLHVPPFMSNQPNGETYQLLTATRLFDLDSTSGTIKTKARIDREEICPSTQSSHRPSKSDVTDVACSIDLQVLRLESLPASNGATEPQVILVKIFILDINDNSPTWQEDTVNISVPEHTPPGARFHLPVAVDADCGPENTTSRYFLFPASNIPDSDYGSQMGLNADITRYFKLDTEVVEQKEAHPFGMDRWNSGWSLQACTGPTFRLWLQIIGELDYETPVQVSAIQQKQILPKEEGKTDPLQQRTFVLKLAGVDGSRFVPKTGSVTIRVSVRDVNDHSPYFLPPESSSVDGVYTKIRVDGSLRRNSVTLEVQENAPYGQVLYTPRVVEPDVSDRENLVFSFDSTTTPAARAVFGIREKDGTIFLKQSPDYEAQSSYTLPVVVSDGKFHDNQEVRIEILNLNDHPPNIIIRPVRPKKPEGDSPNQQRPSQSQRYKPIYLEVEENRPPGYFIATVLLSDEDQVGFPNEGTTAFQCQLSHDSLSLEPLFEGSQSQFKLVTRVSFDREQLAELFIALTCHDSGQPRQTSRVDIRLMILDKNDNKPVFKHHPTVTRVKENSPIGVNVYRLEAFDADVGKNAALVYSIAGEGSENFKIDPHSGLITTAAPIDREVVGKYNLMVIVRDREGNDTGSKEPVNEGSAMLTIEVLDENDCAPEFDKPLYQFLIDENAKINSLIGEVKARDNDATSDNNRITYFIKEEIMNPASQDFRLTADGRVLVAREALDRETTGTYLFTVVAADSGKPPLSATAQVQIHLGDINDNPPTWLFPPESNVVVNVTIHEPVGQQVALLRATDPDLGENGQVVFKIMHVSVLSNTVVPGDTHNETQGENELIKHEIFELDPSTGALYIARPLRPPDMGLVKLLIEASDLGKPNKSSHRTILFNIMDFQRPRYADSGTNRMGAPLTAGGAGFQHHDLVVIVVMVAVAIVISLFLIVAMLFLRCPMCLFHDRGSSNYNNTNQTTVGFPANHQGTLPETYLPEVFRDSHVVGTLGGKDGSLASGEETLFYPTDRDKMIPSRCSVSGKNVFTIDYDGTLQDGTLGQGRQFFILAKPEGNYAVSMDGAPIELSNLENATASRHHQQQQQQQQQVNTQQSSQQANGGHEMRTSHSASCLSGISSTQLTNTPNGYRSESDLDEDPPVNKKITWRLRKKSGEVERKAKAATLGRATSPPRKTFKDENCYSRGVAKGSETLRLLSTTAPATPSGSGSAQSDAVKDRQCYTMLVSAPSNPGTASKVTADQLRYVQIHNTPTHLGGGGGGAINSNARGSANPNKKSTPTVSWRMEPHELHTYSPDTASEQTGAFVDIDNDYARLGKSPETNGMPSYDQLVHQYREREGGGSRNCVQGSGSFSDFPSSVI